MKRFCLTVLLGFFILESGFISGIAAQDESADKIKSGKEVLEKMIEAQGGREVLSQITDMTTSGTMEMIQIGLSGELTMYQKEPDKMRMDFEVMGIVMSQGYNGEKAWMTNPETGSVENLSELESEDFKKQSMGNESLLNPEKYGITYTLERKELLKGKEYLVLKQAFSDGTEIILFIDPETHLIFKSQAKTYQRGVQVDIETFMSDYRTFQNTVIPYNLIVYQDGEEAYVITVSEIKYNTGLEDSLFLIE